MASKYENSDGCFINLEDDLDDFDNDDFDNRQSVVTEQKKKITSELIDMIESDDPQEKICLNQSVLNIIENHDYEAFRYLLENGYKLQAMNDKGQTALHLAFYHNAHAIFTLLKKDDFCKLIDSDYTDCNGLTHFHIACAKGHLKLVETLLEYTADINACFHTDPSGHRNGFTAFHFATTNCTRQKEEIMKLLIERGADVHATDSLKRTALHLACSIFDRPRSNPPLKTSLKVMHILVGKCQIDVNVRDAHNNTPLLCIFPKNYNELELIYYKFEFHQSDFIAETKEKLEFLLKRGADITASNNDGDNVLHLILMILRQSRYRPSSDLRSFINCLEVTDVNFIEFSHFDVHYEEMIKKILRRKKKVNVNAQNRAGQTPIKLAVSCMNINIVKMLLKCGANVNSLKFDEPNFFCYLSLPPNYDVVKNLINLLELLESNGFVLTLEDNLEVLKFLIHSHADCKCDIKTYTKCSSIDASDTIDNLMCVGSPRHIKYILQNMSDDRKLEKNDYHSYDDAIAKLYYYLDSVKVAKINIDKEVRDLATELIVKDIGPSEFKMYFGENEYLLAEGPKLESVVLGEDIKLTDILQKKPEDIPHYIVNNYFSREIVHEFNQSNQAIRGHMVKNIVRYYTIKSATDYSRELFHFSLPDHVIKTIMNFLDNEDILNMCVAAMITNDGS